MTVILRDCYYCQNGIDSSQWHVHVKHCKSRTSKYRYPFNWGKSKIELSAEIHDKDISNNEDEGKATHNPNKQPIDNQNKQHWKLKQIFTIPKDITNCNMNTLQKIKIIKQMQQQHNDDALEIIPKQILEEMFNIKLKISNKYGYDYMHYIQQHIQQHGTRGLSKRFIFSHSDGGPG
eukprot:540586_1